MKIYFHVKDCSKGQMTYGRKKPVVHHFKFPVTTENYMCIHTHACKPTHPHILAHTRVRLDIHTRALHA
jgi:hypothetical protein